MKKLIIAEKPSVGKTIAKAVGASESDTGYMEGNDFVVSWCVGHLMRNADPEIYDSSYKQWDLSALPIIPSQWKTMPIAESKKQLEILRKLAARNDISGLVEATDAGREGELIFRLVYDEIMKGISPRKPFERLWISSLEESAIKEGMKNLKPSTAYDLLYNAALARSRADWIYGLNGTRYYTLTSGESGVKSVGRVQTPTLAMIVNRQREIQNFKVQKRWAIVKNFGTWKLETDKFEKEDEAKKAFEKTDGKPVGITKVERTSKKQGPPLLHSLTTLQQEANRRFGMTAAETLEVMQKLYEEKVLSYPRTDSNYITSDMAGTMNRIIINLASRFKKDIPEWQNQGTKRLVNDAKVSDHYAVIVTESYSRNPDDSRFSEKQKDILRLVETRILEAVAPWHEYEETRVTGNCEGFVFGGIGRTIRKNGWKDVAKAILSKDAKGGGAVSNVFPDDIAEGKKYMAEKTTIETRDTTPPLPYTEETLLGAMEKAGAKEMDDEVERKGLGTSSTRAAIIEILLKRGYIIREAAKNSKARKCWLKATASGEHLIDIVDEGFKSVDTTVEWENRLLKMEREGKENTDDFCASITAEVSKLLADVAKLVPTKDGVRLGACPVCGKDIVTARGNAVCDGCGRRLFRTSRFFRHMLSDEDIGKLLAGGKIPSKIHSEKTNKDYDCLVSISKEKSSADEKYISFGVEFEEKKKPASGNEGEDVGTCPICGKTVKTAGGNAICSGCSRVLYGSSKFFKKTFTADDFRTLFSGGTVKTKFHSEKKNKDYDCEVSIDREKSEADAKRFSLGMEFPKKK